jgi:hypothetical protein
LSNFEAETPVLSQRRPSSAAAAYTEHNDGARPPFKKGPTLQRECMTFVRNKSPIFFAQSRPMRPIAISLFAHSV